MFWHGTRSPIGAQQSFTEFMRETTNPSEVATLLAPLLENSDPLLRGAMVHAFAAIPPGNEAAFRALSGRLHDPSPEIFRHTVEALRPYVQHLPDARRAFVSLLNDPDFEIVEMAIKALAPFAQNNERIRLAIAEKLSDRHHVVRGAAAVALRSSLQDEAFQRHLISQMENAGEYHLAGIAAAISLMPRPLPAFIAEALLRLSEGTNVEVSHRALHGLVGGHRYSDKHETTPETRLGLYRLLLSPPEATVKKRHRAVAIALAPQHGRNQREVVRQFLGWLANQGSAVTEEIFARDAAITGETNFISEILQDSVRGDHNIRSDLRVFLQRNPGIATQRALFNAFVEGAKSDYTATEANRFDDVETIQNFLGSYLSPPHSIETRLAALEALHHKRYSNSHTNLLDDDICRAAIPLLTAESPHAERALVILSEHASTPEVWAAVVPLARKQNLDDAIRTKVIENLSTHAARHQNDLPDFFRFCESTNFELRFAATNLLFLTDAENIPNERALAALNDENSAIRAVAAEKLNHVYSLSQPRIISALRTRLQDPEPAVRQAALWVLFPHISARAEEIIPFFSDPNLKVATTALTYAADYIAAENHDVNVATALVDALIPLTRSSEHTIREASLRTLAQALPRNPNLFLHFLPRLTDENTDVQRLAAQLTAHLYAGNETLVNDLLQMPLGHVARREIEEARARFVEKFAKHANHNLDPYLPYSAETVGLYLSQLDHHIEEYHYARPLLRPNTLINELDLVKVLNYVREEDSILKALKRIEARQTMQRLLNQGPLAGETLLAVSGFLNSDLPRATYGERVYTEGSLTHLEIRATAARILSHEPEASYDPIQARMVSDHVQSAITALNREARTQSSPIATEGAYRDNGNPEAQLRREDPKLSSTRADLARELSAIHVDTSRSPGSLRVKAQQLATKAARAARRAGQRVRGIVATKQTSVATQGESINFSKVQLANAMRAHREHTLPDGPQKSNTADTSVAVAEAEVHPAPTAAATPPSPTAAEEVDAILADLANHPQERSRVRVSADDAADEIPYLRDEDFELVDADEHCVSTALKAQLSR